MWTKILSSIIKIHTNLIKITDKKLIRKQIMWQKQSTERVWLIDCGD